MTNLADDPAYASTKRGLADRLKAYLRAKGDPRETSQAAPWDDWPVLPEPE